MKQWYIILIIKLNGQIFWRPPSLINPKNIEKGSLSAYFASVDQGADHWFECSNDFEENVLILLRTLSELGCRIKQVSHLSFPYN